MPIIYLEHFLIITIPRTKITTNEVRKPIFINAYHTEYWPALAAKLKTPTTEANIQNMTVFLSWQ